MSAPPRPLNLAVIIERYAPDAGGAEKSTAQILQRLVERGHRVTLIAGACHPTQIPEGVTTHRLASRKSSSVFRLARFARWADRLVSQGKYNASLSVTMAVPATVVQPRGGTVRETLDRTIAVKPTEAARRKKRLAVALDPKQRLLLHLEKRTLRHPRVKAIAAVSGYVVDQLHRHYGISPDRCRVIPNAAVMPAIDEAKRNDWRQRIRVMWGIDDDATVYLFAAQNPMLKGFGTLIPAFKRLVESQQVRKPVLLLAGQYGYTVLPHLDELKLREHVRMLGPTRHMPELYAAADVTVLPSYYDPSSKVVLESLMMRTPAISTRFNGASDHLQPSATAPGAEGSSGPQSANSPHPRGLVIADPADVSALHNAMRQLADADFRGRCAAACAGLSDQLSMDRHVAALETLLQETARP